MASRLIAHVAAWYIPTGQPLVNDMDGLTIGMDAQAKTTLAPIQPVRTSLCITKARDGSLLLAEMTPQVPGQVDMDGDETPMPAMARVGRAGY